MTNVSVIALDVETTINGGEVHGPHPRHPLNRVVLSGHQRLGSSTFITPHDHGAPLALRIANAIAEGNDVLLVGHNIGFDLKYLIRDYPPLGPLIRSDKVRLWDTQVAEYLIHGQDNAISLTLEDTCQRYGIPFKKSEEISKAFKAMQGADKIPSSILIPYLKDDVEVLHTLLHHQLHQVNGLNMQKVVQMRMEARKWLIFAEYYGMKIDKSVILGIMPSLEREVHELAEDLTVRYSPEASLDLTKPLQLATYLYGGTIKYEVTENVGLYKNGKVKTKKVEKTHPRAPMVAPGTRSDRSVDEETLRELLTNTTVPSNAKSCIELVLRYRDLSKELNTYCHGLLKHAIDDWIYANINTTVTTTGRLSSSKPNLQNIKNGRLKAAFVSRYGREGRLIEIDFAQLEIIALAILSQDSRLIEDILNGVDIHTALYEDMYHRTPTKAERKAFKPRTFSLVYGAQAKGIATAAKISIGEAHTFIRTFYARYSGVKRWHEQLMEEPKGRCTYDSVNGNLKFVHVSPTGLRLTYRGDKVRGMVPTQLVNYPVQSFAADLVQLMVARLAEALVGNFPTAFIVNVVHDSIIIDCQAHEAENVAKFAIGILRDTPKYMQSHLGIDMTPLTRMEVGATIGVDWYNMHDYTPEEE